MATKVKAAAVTAEPAPLQGPLLSHLKGHGETIRVLREAVERDRLPSTMIFSGPSGIGKKLAALGLAQVLLCERRTGENVSACGECGPCVRTTLIHTSAAQVSGGQGPQSESVMLVEPQGAGIKIEQAQGILQFIGLRQLGRARVVIINEAHLMNPQTGNALLKSLEEPSPGTHFILLTSRPGALLATIRSRAQLIRFQALSDEVVASLVRADDWIIRSAQGSVEAASRMAVESEEWAGLRQTALSAMAGFVGGRLPENYEELRESLKDRNGALFVTQVWGRVLRDFALQAAMGGAAAGEQLLLPDNAELSRDGGRIAPGAIHRLSELCLEFEQDIQRNVDRGLALESFSYAVIGAYK